ncbi:MAG: tryptophan synthase subunit alpha [Gammaproteobacteria bacterium]
MSRIAGRFRELREAGRTALVPFVTAGDPGPEITVPLMHAMVAAGADLVELGVPFSDPMADGPVIQKANERALAGGMSLRRTVELVAEFRRDDERTPVVLMGYLNPLECMGYEAFAAAAGAAGVDGVITVDLTPEESGPIGRAFAAENIDAIYLLAPTSSDRRIANVCKVAGGFVYYVSLKGVTGSAALDVEDVAWHLERIRALSDLPVGVGFGIRDPESAARVSVLSDAVIVGSVLVNEIEALAHTPQAIPEALAAKLAAMRGAMDGAGAPDTAARAPKRPATVAGGPDAAERPA